MKPYKKKTDRERVVSAPGKDKPKDKKIWQLEYRWISLSDYNTYPKEWFRRKEDGFNREWKSAGVWSKYKTVQGAEEALKKDLRSSWMMRYIKGRDWRVRNLETNETIDFLDIQNFYL